MSTSYYVRCETCKVPVTDVNDCDNHPDIPLTIVQNIIPYAHLAMLIEDLPVSPYAWLDVDIKISGYRIDLSNLRKHVTHQLAVYDEYGYVYPAKACSNCKHNFCVKVKNIRSDARICCEKCDH